MLQAAIFRIGVIIMLCVLGAIIFVASKHILNKNPQ